MYLVIH